jgi:iron complex transport system permease protein
MTKAAERLSVRRTLKVLGLLLGILALVGALSLSIGTTGISLDDLLALLSGQERENSDIAYQILILIRLPRILLAVVVGAGLSVAGATFQALLRNPLAEPYVLGISSGGTVGAILAMVSGIGLAQITTPVFSFCGSLTVMLLVFSLGKRRGFMDPHSLLLSGVMIGAFFNAVVLLVVAIFNQEMRTAFLWLLGNLSNAEMSSLTIVGPLILASSLGLMMFGNAFNLIAMGDEAALTLGVEVPVVRRRAYLLASLITGLGVSVSGVIGFVGLLVPHACRLMIGPDHRLLLPASFLLGGTFLVLCDLLARTVMAPSEIPVGAITAAVGAPLFIYLLKRDSARL